MLAALAALAITLPRALALGPAVERNLVLEQRLLEVDRRLAEVDRMLLRLRGYDARIEALVPLGEHGPLAESPHAEQLSEWRAEQPDRVLARADVLVQRSAELVGTLRAAEPGVAEVARDLELQRALEAALPRVWPADGWLSSAYGVRDSPFGGRWDHHGGLDIAGDRGDPIFASSAGEVIRAEWHSGYGRVIEIDHGMGIHTVYAHCRRLLVGAGSYVEEGELIATMGQTGRTTGPHLHFELRFDGRSVDPLPYLPLR